MTLGRQADRYPTTPRPRPHRPRGMRSARAPRHSATGGDGVRTTCSARSTSSTRPSASPPPGSCSQGTVVSLSQSFDTNGPQKGWRRRTNPVHTMTDTGVGCRARQSGLPARHRRGGRRHLDAAAVLDPMGRPRPHLRPRHGVERAAGRRRRHERGRPRHGHRARGIRHRLARRAAGRRAATCAPRRASSKTATRSPPPTSTRRSRHRAPRAPSAAATSCSSAPASSPAPAAMAGATTPAVPHPASRSRRPAGCTAPRSRRSPPTRGASRCGPNEFDVPAFQPLHQVVIPNLGLTIGELWDLDALAVVCARAGPVRLPAVGRAAAHHRGGRLADQPRRHPLDTHSNPEQRGSEMTAVSKVAIAGAGVAGLAAAIQLAKAGVDGRRVRGQARAQRARVGHLAAGQRPARLRRPRRVGRHPRRRLPVRGTQPARSRPGRADRRGAAGRQSGRTRLSGADGDAARGACPDPLRARPEGGRDDPLRLPR